ncbi:class I ribonucleotide reductase maintenance protein YfaE [Rosenbergiella epipactidis]|uniref:class I ribonucleotide reductase maintenance protein YfaE n=1 Tax=Rosenbergiella epipactidis TaxID=1544694 RepID=UPI0023DF8CF1|nr:class I ribonucleotide reductase maintenance protein YfaE [Rosenbergiella epipactidis]
MATKPARITLSHSGKMVEPELHHSSLLQTLEHHQLEVEYQCREGYCGSCRVKLCKGRVCYASQPLAFIQQGEILPCCCQPDGDIEIEL